MNQIIKDNIHENIMRMPISKQFEKYDELSVIPEPELTDVQKEILRQLKWRLNQK